MLDDLDESVLLGIAEVAAISTNRWLVRIARAVPARAGWGHSLGRIATAQIEMASAYMAELEKLLPQEEMGQKLAKLGTAFRAHDADLLEHVYDLDTPTELASAVLSARRFTPAMFALGFAIKHPGALPASVVNEVAQEFAAAAQNALRLVAAHVGGGVEGNGPNQGDVLLRAA